MSNKHSNKPRTTLPDLKELGSRLKKVDQHIVALLSKRMTLAKQVQEWKKANDNQPIIRFQVEEERLEKIKVWAEKRGINPAFAKAVLYFIIAESCRVQINHLQTKADDSENLQDNLLNLTSAIAPSYNEYYGKCTNFATASYIQFEDKEIKREIGTLKSMGNLDLALDLGCATGRITFGIATHFKKTIGYDISPKMIEEANKKKNDGLISDDIEFTEIDIEKGIPIKNNSVSLVVMNLGTASDVCNFRYIAAATKRVLKKDGRFVFSFYNTGALLYNWFVPWPPSLNAEINLDSHCLDVKFQDKTFRINARPYSVREVKKVLTENGLIVSTIKTYPTISPILPSEFFDEEDSEKSNEIKKTIEEIDVNLANLNKGAFILVTGRKP